MNTTNFNKTELIEWAKHHNFDTQNIKKPSEFNSEFKDIMSAAFDLGLRTQDSGDISSKRHDMHRELDKRFSNTTGKYKFMYSNYLEVQNHRNQYQWADMKERFRFLLFRTLTAIAFSMTLLGTGYLANKLEIPLPLLRLAG